MEADFNFANHLYFGKQMKASAETYNIPPDDTFRSREYTSSIEVALCRLIFFDLVRQLKSIAVLGFYGAQTRYNRVVHSFTSMAAREICVPRTIINTLILET